MGRVPFVVDQALDQLKSALDFVESPTFLAGLGACFDAAGLVRRNGCGDIGEA